MGIGEHLRLERELRGVPIEEVSRVTRIPRSTLALLEADALERLPGRVYIVGYLRAYATVVGLDAEELLLRYQEETGETPAIAPTPTPPVSRWRVVAPLAVVMAAIVLLGLGLFRTLSP